MNSINFLQGHPLLLQALTFCIGAHSAIGQKRKYTGENYYNHPIEVARIVASVTDDVEMIAAALMHDTVEDTQVTLEDIDVLFGYRITNLVDELTDPSKPEDGNRKTRKAIDRNHTATASQRAKTIKLADLIDNSRSIVTYDKDFARVYIKEKELLLQVLHLGNSELYKIATKQVADAKMELGID